MVRCVASFAYLVLQMQGNCSGEDISPLGKLVEGSRECEASLSIMYPLAGLISFVDLAMHGVGVLIECLPEDGLFHLYLEIGSHRSYRSLSGAEIGEGVTLWIPLGDQLLARGESLRGGSKVPDGVHALGVSLFGGSNDGDEEDRVALKAQTMLDVRHYLDVDVVGGCPLCRFTTFWMEGNLPAWEALLLPARTQPTFSLSILEVGSWEGMSAIWFGKNLTPKLITCVDTWQGGQDHLTPLHESLLADLEGRFDHNIDAAQLPMQTAVEKRKGYSDFVFAALVAEQRRYDLIYIDGAHTAMSVLADAVMALRMLSVGGYLIFDDWVWNWSLKTGALNNASDNQDTPGVQETHEFITRIFAGVLERVKPCANNQGCFRKTDLLDSERH